MCKLAQKIASFLIIFMMIGNIVVPVVVNAANPSFGSFSDETQDNFEKGIISCAAIFVVTQLISSILGAFNVPTNDVPTNWKEMILDCVFWAFKNAIIQEITGSTVQWVQKGMGGNPAFVQNVGQYLRGVADRVAGSYIQEIAPFLCSPFKADIQLQLNLFYRNSTGRNPRLNSSCTLTESVDNIESFLGGDFYAGGWDGWRSVFSNPQNNPYGAYFEARNELSIKIESAAGEAETKLSFGNGFLSKEVQDCYLTPADGMGPPQPYDETQMGPPNGTVTCDPPRIVTPGAQVKTSLEQAFGVNLDQIASADEFDEIFSLLAAWLISDILTEEEGLAGYDPDNIDHTLPPPPPGDDDLDDTTPGDSEPSGPAGPSLCFEKNGTFLTPTQGGTVTAGFSFGVPERVSYDRIELEMDVTNDGWPAEKEGWPVGLFWLARPGNSNLFGYSKVNAPGTSNLTLAHGIGLGHASKVRVLEDDFIWPEDATYRFKYVYNAKGQQISLNVSEIGQAGDIMTGGIVTTLNSVPTVPGINTGNETFNLSIGYRENETNPKERPMYGWDYSNLKVSFLSEGNKPPTSCSTPSPFNGVIDRPSDGPVTGDDDDDDNPPEDEEAALVRALNEYAKTGDRATDPVVLKYLRPSRTDNWNGFGGSQNLAPLAFAAVGDYQFFQELAAVENTEGIGSREFGSPGFYFSMPIAAKIVALRDARTAGDTAAVAAISKNLLQTWTIWSLVAQEGRRTSITANAAGNTTSASGDGNINGLAVAVAGDRWNSTGDAASYKTDDLSTILAWALDVPRSSGNSRNLRTATAVWWDTIIANAIGVDRYIDSTSPEAWGLTSENRANLQKLVKGDMSVLPWAMSVVAPGLYANYAVRMRRTTEGVETVLFSSSNGNKPAQAATSITNAGAMRTMRPCGGNASGQNAGYNVAISGGTITAGGDPPRCVSVSQPELSGSIIYDILFDNGTVIQRTTSGSGGGGGAGSGGTVPVDTQQEPEEIE